ncbi:MAG TPA: N-acetyl-gamma-glutamyl-phosphate reductase [Ruminococcaceae bacterium]|nr:N-acetyl-gamma-glutamyl-phosphate reductase [Oscillospiraceae bacterium]
MKKVFIDGAAGTTGLKIFDRLKKRKDIELITLDEELRKDPSARRQALNNSDIAFLCLPDDASREAVAFCENPDTVIIDTSTAHRTADGWAYGFPELSGQREIIANSKRIANPGCHASGVISLLKPLLDNNAINASAFFSCFSMTGYSGGGKKMIADYETKENKEKLLAPRMYGLRQSHKHLPEIVKVCGLEKAPAFCPVVSSYYSGMQVVIPISRKDICIGIEDIKDIYRRYYKSGLVSFSPDVDENGFVSSSGLSGFDNMKIGVFGNDERITLVSLFDNLGKGASGAAIQNMNISLGLDQKTGLIISED